MRRPRLAVLALAAVLAVGCADRPLGGDNGAHRGTATLPVDVPGVEELRVEMLETLPHDEDLFTQGLEIADGVLYEGTGLVGESRLQAIPLPVPGRVLAEVTLPEPLFGEGITVVGARLWQLTWTDGVAIERDRETLSELRRVRYDGEGWGLCSDGERLVMSDGTARLTFRDPASFAPTGSVQVHAGGRPVPRLNELECAGGAVWANVWQTDRIARIEPSTGAVTGVADASGLLSTQQRAGAGVLNGIAAVPGTGEFLITGKNWPAMFRVRFVPA